MDKALLLASAIADVKKQLAELQTKATEIQKLEVPSGPKGDKGDQGPKGDRGERGLDGKAGKDGKDGKDGVDGESGKDGISVVDAKVDFDGSLVITLSDGREIDCGQVSVEQSDRIVATLKQTADGGTGGGAVLSVNGFTGAVTLAAADVGAASNTQGSKADTAHGWGNHAAAGYLNAASIGTAVQAYDADLTSWAALAPASKQDTLTSGTTIKTVNSTSLLGSGDIAVQATLVSGSNIKTVGGTSLLGSGDISSFLAKATSVFTTGTAQTYTAPASTEWVKVTVVGPGGNGGGAASQRATGGGGGAKAIKWLQMTAGQTLTYTVGTASGTASTVSSGTLTITTISAGSGANGTGTAYAATTTAGGAGGTATGGDINISGGVGGPSYGSSTTVLTNYSGFGGDCPGFGTGGTAVGCVALAGVQGNGYGSGGGGAHGSASTAAGRGGLIIFEAY